MYETLKTLCPHGYHYSGFVVAHALGHMILLLTIYIVLPATFLNALLVYQYKQRVIVHHVLLYMSYYKPTVVITGRAYRFHDFMIYNIHHASARLRTFCVVDHLWKLIFCFLLSFLSIFFDSLEPALYNSTSYIQVHKLLQSHCSDDPEGTLFSWFHIYITLILFLQGVSTWNVMDHL